MKNIFNILIGFLLLTATSCTYTFPEAEEPTAGSADFTKVVAVGNSLTAGFMNGALYNDGQANSYATIIAQQMGTTFNQPDINSENGYYGMAGSVVLGRLHLVGLENPAPSPIVPGDAITPYSGDKSALNNFGVPGMRIVDFETIGYGSAAGNPYFNRFASSDGTSVMADVIAANGTFFTFWLGNNDVLGYALDGATGDTGGSNSDVMTPVGDFTSAYSAAILAMTANGAKGIVANIPSISNIAHFTTVTWDAIEFDSSKPESQLKIDALNEAFGGLNAALDSLNDPQFVLDSADLERRKVIYSLGNNPILIHDGSLTDLGPFFDDLVDLGKITSEDRLKLEPYRQSRPLDNSVLVTLTAGSVLGTLADPNNPESAIGVTVPLQDEDQYTLTNEEQNAIADRIAAFNKVIEEEVNQNDGLVLLDMNAEFLKLSTDPDININGAGVDTSILPPFGLFSLDGIHPNARGYAYVASLFIDKINESFGSNIPNVNPNNYAGNELPVPQ